MGLTEKEAIEAQKREDFIKKNELIKEKPVKTAGQKRFSRAGDVGRWFQTLCIINIPVIGFIYIIIMALRRKTPYERKSFAIAYILFKLLVWILAISVIYCLYKVGINFIDGILQYASGN